jgi:tetratricopeptide (TPR) repeat protein
MMRRPTLALVIGAFLAGLTCPLGAQNIKLKQSLHELEEAARRDSNDAQALYALALGYWSKKRYDDAERVLRQSVAIEPRFAPGHLALGVLPYARRPKLREEEAKGKVPEEWRHALVESRRLTRHAFLIDPFVDLRILGAVDPPQAVTMGVVKGRLVFFTNPFVAFQQGRYDLAFAFFDRALGAARDSLARDSVPSVLLWYHALCAAHLQKNAVAIDDLQTLLDRTLARERSDSLTRVPLGTNDLRYMLGLMHQRMYRWSDAVRWYRAALENDLGLYMAHVQLYKTYEARGMFDSAVVESRAAVLTNPDDPSLLLDHGILLTRDGDLGAAEDTLRRAMEASPRDSRVPYYLGIALQRAQKPADARAAFERFLTLAPSRYEPQIRDARDWVARLP